MSENAVYTSNERGARRAVLTYGPVLTLVLLVVLSVRGNLAGPDLVAWSMAAAVLWSPLPISLPAVLLDRERDTAAVPGFGLARAVALMPWLMFSPASAVRRSAVASVVSWLALLGGLLLLNR